MPLCNSLALGCYNELMEKELNFAQNLVKGKIAETIFAQMFRRMKTYTVLEFGYEKVIPELVQRGIQDADGVMSVLRSAPDFAVIDMPHKHVKLIEVKYQRRLSETYVLRDAQRMREAWNPSFLFVASLDGFYMDGVDDIVENQGRISPLSYDVIPKEIQEDYLKVLCDFEDGK